MKLKKRLGNVRKIPTIVPQKSAKHQLSDDVITVHFRPSSIQSKYVSVPTAGWNRKLKSKPNILNPTKKSPQKRGDFDTNNC